MTRGRRYPSHLTWDHDPSDAELTQIVGPDFTATRMVWREDDERIRVQPKRLVFWRAFSAVVFMCLVITGWTWLYPWLFERTTPMDPLITYTILGFLWLVLVPCSAWILRREARHAAARPPSAVVDKSTRELALPDSEHVVHPDHIVRFVELRGVLQTRQAPSAYRQLGVVFREGPQFVFASFARLRTPGVRRSVAARLADHYDRPLQSIKAGTLVSN